MVSVSGYLIGSQESGKMPLPPNAELQWWYQFYFATERGRIGYDKNRHDFAKLIWKQASPKWNFTMRPSSVAHRPLIIRTMSTLRFTITVGGLLSLKANRNMMTWKSSGRKSGHHHSNHYHGR